MEKTLKPSLRFKGFTEAWEQCKLGDLGISTGGTSIESEFSKDGKYKVISIGSYSESSIYNDQGIKALDNEKTKIRVLNKDDLTMILNDKTASGRIIGRVLLIDRDNTYVYNQRTQRIEPNSDKFDALFLYHLLNAPQKRDKIVKQVQGNTQIYVNWSAIKETEYLIPKLDEQIVLGEYFESITNLITLHQRKYDKLVNVKKALLNKMFPKNGELVPKLRFRGFTDTWEQLNLKGIFNYERPDAYIVESEKYSNQFDTPVLTANKGFILGYTNETRTYDAPCIIFDDFTLDSKLVDFPFMVKSSAMKMLTTKNDIDLRFSFELLNNAKIENLGHARHYISVVQPTEVRVPKYNEQAQISKIFTSIDSLITLHQHKYGKLVNIKKALLQKMFV